MALSRAASDAASPGARDGTSLAAAATTVLCRKGNGKRGEEQWGVDVAGVVGGEDHGSIDMAQMFGAADGCRGDEVGDRSCEVVEDHRPGQPNRIATRHHLWS